MQQCTENILLNNSNYVPIGIDETIITVQERIASDINAKLLDYRNKLWFGLDTKSSLNSIIDSVINQEFIYSVNLFEDITCVIKKTKLTNVSLNTNQTISVGTAGNESDIGGGVGGGGIGTGGDTGGIDIPDIIPLIESGYLYGNGVSILFANDNFIDIPI